MNPSSKIRLNLDTEATVPKNSSGENLVSEGQKSPISESVSPASSDVWEKETVSSDKTSIVSHPEKLTSRPRRLNGFNLRISEKKVDKLWEKVKRQQDEAAGIIPRDESRQDSGWDKGLEGMTDMERLRMMYGPEEAENRIEMLRNFKEAYGESRELTGLDSVSASEKTEKTKS